VTAGTGGQGWVLSLVRARTVFTPRGNRGSLVPMATVAGQARVLLGADR
jgi:hypothetical protein